MSPWSKQYEYSRLDEEDCPAQISNQNSQTTQLSHISRPGKDRTWALYGFILALAALNAVQLIMSSIIRPQADTGCSRYSKLPFDTSVAYHGMTQYWGDNQTLADQSWDALDANPVAIALDKGLQKEYKLQPSAPFPWDPDKGLYFVKAFHHLHCLRLIRRAFVDLERGSETIVMSHHVHHCLDALRQDTMCKADDTPMPISYQEGSVGDGQVMECRNWDQLVAWTQDLTRNACFKMPANYKEVNHTLEQYAFCPEDSPYHPIMNAYFEKWGHKETLVV